MKKLILFLFFNFIFLCNLFSQTCGLGNNERLKIGYQYDLSNVLEAISYVESRGNDSIISKNKKCVGILQITPIVVKECNEILGTKKYNLKDRLSKEKSFEMFYLIQKKYNKSGDIKKAAYVWRGGNQKENEIYYKKVLKRLNNRVIN